MADLFTETYNPDVLSCLANLSNDEVFTPPEVANQVLDMLPDEIWEDPDAAFLDPACKSGIFLREIAKRLIVGLEDKIPDLDERLEHIYKKQLFGIATTELCSLLSRRSLYCSKYPNSKYSVVSFDNAEGNVRYRRTHHTWKNDRCVWCGAAKVNYDRDESLEQHAYEFIHPTNLEEIKDMKFDVIVGNPPYQLSDGGGNGSSAMPIYQKFISNSIKLKPRFLCMIVPAKWQSGGKGLDSFRYEMLHDKHLRRMVTYADSRDCFSGVDIAGGVTYFLWDRDNPGTCKSSFFENGEWQESERYLDELPIFVASDTAMGIIRKVKERTTSFYDQSVMSRNPFGIGAGKKSQVGDLTLRYRGGLTKVPWSSIKTNAHLIDKWKVIVSKAAAEHAGQSDKQGQRKMLSVIEVLPPRTICSETYLVVSSFDSEDEANSLASYLRTKFARYLIWQATPTQNISKSCFSFLPVIQLEEGITDENLFGLFCLDDLQKEEIIKKIKEMDSGE